MQTFRAEQEIKMYWREVEHKAPEAWRVRQLNPRRAHLLLAAFRSILALFAH